MAESEFSMNKAAESTKVLQNYFEGREKLDPEFIWSAQIIIEGAYFRNEIEVAKSNPQYLSNATKTFCEFMRTKAYYVH